jgi:hypothetical protein
VIAGGRHEVPFGLEAALGVAYVVIGQPERVETSYESRNSRSMH